MDTAPKKRLFGLTPILVVVLLLAIVVIELQLIAMQVKIEGITRSTTSLPSTDITQDLNTDDALKPSFMKRTLEFTQDSDIKNVVYSVDEQNLIGLRCTETIVNDGEGKYYWRSPYEHDLYDEIDDPIEIKTFQTINAGLPPEKTAISGRFCETEYGNILVHYVVSGKETFGGNGFYHGRDADAYVSVLDENGQFSQGILLGNEIDWPYALCKHPIQLTKEGDLYVLCSVSSGANAKNTLYVADLTTGVSEEKVKCDYLRGEGAISESCEVF